MSMDQNHMRKPFYNADSWGTLPAPRSSDPGGLGGPGNVHINKCFA